MTWKVYTTRACPWCRRAKAWLKSKGLPFVEIDVSRDDALVDEMRRVSGQCGVPVVTDGRALLIGFDEARFDGLAGSRPR